MGSTKEVGVDGAPDMVRSAVARGVDARVMDGHALGFGAEFDAVFSNAALQWAGDHESVLRLWRAQLAPGGTQGWTWNNANPLSAAHFVNLAPTGSSGTATFSRSTPSCSPRRTARNRCDGIFASGSSNA